jgi:hypothetical protein
VTKPVASSPAASWRAAPTETWGVITGGTPATLGPAASTWICYTASVPVAVGTVTPPPVTGMFELVLDYCTRGYA